MRLAVIDAHDQILIFWPRVQDAHTDIADLLAARCYPGRFQRGRRDRLALALREHLLELQEETRTLQVGPPPFELPRQIPNWSQELVRPIES